MPLLMSELESDEGQFHMYASYITGIMTDFWPSIQDSPAMHGAALQIIDRTYDTLFYLNEKLNGSHYGVSDFCRSKIFWASNLPYHWPLAHVLDFASFFGRWDYIQYHMSKESDSTQEDVERVVSSAILGLAYVGRWLYDNKNIMNYINRVVDILLNYLPRSTKTEMHASTVTVNDQVDDHSKWTMLLASVSQLMSDVSITRRNEKEYQEVIGLCKQVIKTLMEHEARADINMLLMCELCVDIGHQTHKSIRMILKETLLAFVKRRPYRSLDVIRDIEAFLCDFGATDRRIFHSVVIDYVLDDHGDFVRKKRSMGLRLTDTQSERLSDIYTHEKLRRCLERAGGWGEGLIEFGTDDTMPTEPNPEAEDIVQLLLSQASYDKVATGCR